MVHYVGGIFFQNTLFFKIQFYYFVGIIDNIQWCNCIFVTTYCLHKVRLCESPRPNQIVIVIYTGTCDGGIISTQGDVETILEEPVVIVYGWELVAIL